jgi:hypothetical protein
MELTNKQKQLLINIINNAQNQGVKFLFAYEGSLVMKQKPSEETAQWYNETREEFMELQKVKNMLMEKQDGK